MWTNVSSYLRLRRHLRRRQPREDLADTVRQVVRHDDVALGVAAQAEFESKVWRRFNTVKFQALSSRRLQHELHGFNLHRPTSGSIAMPLGKSNDAAMPRPSMDPEVYRRKLDLRQSLKAVHHIFDENR